MPGPDTITMIGIGLFIIILIVRSIVERKR